MMPGQPGGGKPLDAGQITQFLTNLKRQMSQVEGEISTMKSDSMASLFQNFANMINQVWGMKEGQQKRAESLQKILDDIYAGHPDIKIAMEAEAKELAEINAKKQAKIVKKGK